MGLIQQITDLWQWPATVVSKNTSYYLVVSLFSLEPQTINLVSRLDLVLINLSVQFC